MLIRKSTIFFFVATLLLFTNRPVLARNIIDSYFKEKNITSDCSYFIDSSFLYSIDEVIAEQLSFSTTSKDLLNFGFIEGNVWIKIEVENYSSKTLLAYLMLDNKIVESVSYYEVNNGEIAKTELSGLRIPYSSKKIKGGKPVFRLKMWPHQNKTVYLKVASGDFAFWQKLILQSEETYQSKQAKRIYTDGIHYGLVFVLLMMSLFYFMTLKKKTFLYYIFYQSAILIYLIASDGMLFQIIFSSASDSCIQIYFIASILTQFAILPFATVALKIHQNSKKLFLFILAYGVILFVFLLYSVFGSALPIQLLTIFSSASLLIVVVASILSFNKTEMYLPLYFLASILPIFIIILLFLLRNTGAIELSVGVENIKAGFVIQLLIMSFGLSMVFKRHVKDASKEAIENLENLNRVKDDLNSRLEMCVGERTTELDKAITDLNKVNLKMLEINRKLEDERDKFENQKEILEQQKKELTDSIEYAQRLQRTLMTTDEDLNELFDSKYFVFSLPKDIISGDFYWAGRVGDKTVLTVADCTGHGVPGAFMSVIGITYLREIVENMHIESAADILYNLRSRVVESFQKHVQYEEFPKDGMDLALVVIDKKNKIIDYAGAYNPMYLIRSSVLTTYRPNHLPIGIDERNSQKYTSNIINYKPGDMIYLFSDGYVDQFGWRTGKKFKARQFRELLLDIYELPLEVQKAVIKNSIKNWKGDIEQIDDITIIGLRLE